MGEGLLDLARCCEIFLWNQALYSDRIWFLIPDTMCIPFKYLTFTLLTASISCKLMIFLGTWVNIFPPGGTVVIISITWNVFKAITLLVKIFSYMLDMDLRIGIWNISNTSYKYTSFKPVGFTVQTMELMFIKLVNEESGAEMTLYL